MKSWKEKYLILEEILCAKDLLMTIKRINLGMNLSTHILGSNTKYKFRNLVGQRTVNWLHQHWHSVLMLTMLIMYLCSYHWREGIQYSPEIFINTISYYEELQREIPKPWTVTHPLRKWLVDDNQKNETKSPF